MSVQHNQRGYAGSSRSLRAVAAESEGKLPLTRLCKTYGFLAARVRVFIDPCEAHHTSKYAKLTDYYDPCDAMRFRRYITTRKPSAEQLEARAKILEATIERAQEAGPLCYSRTPYECIYGHDPRSLLARGEKLRC